VTRGLRESAIIVLGLAAAVLFAALATYNPEDPGYAYAGSSAAIHNGVGPLGARVADFLFFWFGRPAFLLPPMLLLPCWILFRRLKGDYVASVNAAMRVTGFAVVVVASCGLASLHWADWPRPQQSAGGVVGAIVGRDGLQQVIGFLGATLVLIAVWMGGLSLSFGVSWFRIMEKIGEWFLSAFGVRRSAPRHASPGFDRLAAGPAAGPLAMSPEQPRSSAAPRGARAARGSGKNRYEPERQVPLFDLPGPEDLPPLDLLDDPPPPEALYSEEELEELSKAVVAKLKEFDIDVEVVDRQAGPVVTRFEINPAAGVKASQITGLAKDLARALAVLSVRVVEVIPGKTVMGLEIANKRRQLVTLGEILRSKEYWDMVSPLSVGLGKDIGGKSRVEDLTRMPHLLIAGTTGSGKSVAINAMILSLLYKATPAQVRLIMIDPKMLELSIYERIPHLYAPVVTDMKQAANALRWCVQEVERRFALMAALRVRNLASLNVKIKEALDAGRPLLDPVMQQRAANDPTIDQSEIPTLEPLPYIVVIIDELADLMMTVGKKVDELIARLAQKARASGVHLMLATQRPSVDVITGLIKANIPCRIAFQVSSKVDSRTILDQMGAETLLGNGDMLYLPAGSGMPLRVHGAFVSDQEVQRVVEYLRSSPPDYNDEILRGPPAPAGEEGEETSAASAEGAESDPLYDEAVRIVTTERKPSISYVQRRLKIGYNRAARLLEAMENAGLVSPLQANGTREVLAPTPAPSED
jgi:S-DNA-T family DNA segregation ATPase FtsK/SpoIIIE